MKNKMTTGMQIGIIILTGILAYFCILLITNKTNNKPQENVISDVNLENYNSAINLIEEKKYPEALDILSSLPADYNDVSNQIKAASEALALELAQKGDIESIQEGLNLLKEAKITSGDVYNEVTYLTGNHYKNKGFYESAMLNYTKCIGYKDADTLYKFCSYNSAIAYMGNGCLSKAIKNFTESKGYKKSNKFLKLCQKYLEFETQKWVIPEEAMDDTDSDGIFLFTIKINKKGKVNIYCDATDDKCKLTSNIIKWNDYPTKYELDLKKLKIRKKTYAGLYPDDDWIVKPVKKINASANYSEFTDEELINKEEENASNDYNDLSGLPERPTIGMTEAEARKTQWGEPNHTNVTETTAGIRKQLCFGNGRYAYVVNGYVTSLQY